MANKVYIVGSSFVLSFKRMFSAAGWEVVNTPEEADYLQFTGGADINPALYGEFEHPQTYFNTQRDEQEVAVYDAWKGRKKLLGVCRGGQLLCAMAGGTLYQHVNNHGREHKVTDVATERSILVSSVHHQMMRPPRNAEVLAICSVATKKEWVNRAGGVSVHECINKTDFPDVEAAYFPVIDALGFQPHPEFGPASCTAYYFELIGRVFK